MDLDLPLILFIAVVVTGVLSVLDLLAYAPGRRVKIAAVEAQFAQLSADSKAENDAYQLAITQAKKESVWAEYAKSFFPVLALVFVLRSFLVEPFQIPSGSMIPTLEVGDYIAVNKFAYGVRLPILQTKIIPIADPQRGDVVVFFPPNDKRYFIKRLVGLPGDTIRYTNNQLYVNGEAVNQTFLHNKVPNYPAPGESAAYCMLVKSQYSVMDENLGGKTHKMQKCDSPGPLSVEGTYVVPAGHYFMMGDNRDNSHDSRAWGAVPDKNIVGKAFAIWMHWRDLTDLPSFSRAGLIP
jgi:signal peptidase I